MLSKYSNISEEFFKMNQSKNHIISGLKSNKITILLFVLLLITIEYSYSQTEYIAGTPKLAIWEIGNSNETIIILHGGPAVEHSYLRPEWDTLSSISRIFYYDQRGCGKSDTINSYTWIDHIQDLKRIKESVSKNNKIILAGSSWGAELALLYSIYYPKDLKALILSGFCGWNGENSKLIDFDNYIADSLYTFTRTEKKSNFEDSIRAVKHIPYKEFFRLAVADNSEKKLKKRMTYSFDLNRVTYNSLKSAPDISFIGKVNVPILTFGRNTICAYQDWSGVIEDLNNQAQRIVIDNSCHDPWFTHPSEFFQECFKFIKSLKNDSHVDENKNTKR